MSSVHSHDDWWNEPGDDPVGAVSIDALDTPIGLEQRRRRKRPRYKDVPMWQRVLRAPVHGLDRILRRSPALRRLFLRIIIIGFILSCIFGAVGIILINNVVIERTAELGALDKKRRDLRRENAALNAQIAKHSAPHAIVTRAEKELGLVRSPTMPSYVWLEPESIDLTALERRRRAQKIRKKSELKQRNRPAETGQSKSKNSAKKSLSKAGNAP